MLGMNNNGDTVVKKQFIITRKVIMMEYHTVDADSKAEALGMVEEYHDEYETNFHDQQKPKFDSILLTYQCSNKHNGWTNVASDVEVGSNRWHYNGMCNGVYQDEDAEMCHECAGALAKGHRPLRQDELQYLSDSYGVVIE
jgi:hypothetical protein|tara:strand:+ start:703 stop:1125 length:423 start_codon:yes stop_codon:yes gene_type:complete